MFQLCQKDKLWTGSKVCRFDHIWMSPWLCLLPFGFHLSQLPGRAGWQPWCIPSQGSHGNFSFPGFASFPWRAGRVAQWLSSCSAVPGAPQIPSAARTGAGCCCFDGWPHQLPGSTSLPQPAQPCSRKRVPVPSVLPCWQQAEHMQSVGSRSRFGRFRGRLRPRHTQAGAVLDVGAGSALRNQLLP